MEKITITSITGQKATYDLLYVAQNIIEGLEKKMLQSGFIAVVIATDVVEDMFNRFSDLHNYGMFSVFTDSELNKFRAFYQDNESKILEMVECYFNEDDDDWYKPESDEDDDFLKEGFGDDIGEEEIDEDDDYWEDSCNDLKFPLN
jgi:hypothetical protein